ncbi:MAG: hypothetical protein J0M24_27410 [Verrucomicrobia bacterium]|nr:hypothetical protein [Verrucomicrobiota bacterium]
MNLDAFPSARRCPACSAVVASRRSRLCGVCEQPLPESVRFTPDEAAQQAAEFQEIRRRQKSSDSEAGTGGMDSYDMGSDIASDPGAC